MKRNDKPTSLPENLESKHKVDISDRKPKPRNLIQEEGTTIQKSLKEEDNRSGDNFGAVSSIRNIFTSKEAIERRGERKTANTLFQLASYQFNIHLDET